MINGQERTSDPLERYHSSVEALPHRSTGDLARVLGVDLTSSSSLVRIDQSVLRNFATHLKNRHDFSEYERSKWDDTRFWNAEDTPATRSQYFTVGNAINFRFWNLVDGRTQAASGWLRGEKLAGSMYLWRSLKRCLEEDKYPILDATFLTSLSLADFEGIFLDDQGHNPLAIAREDRIQNLRDLGLQLEQQWGGQFFNLVQTTKGSLKAFVELSAKFRAFDDTNFKLTMVNAILHSGSGIATFDGDPLPGIDYHLLKQLLRHGILRPQSDLDRQIRNREFLNPSDGQELRRVALVAMVRLSEMTGIGGDILDNKWWWNRTKCRDRDPVCNDPLTASQCPFYGPCEQLTELQFPVEETRYY
jgi:hypothetical protein